MKTKQKYIVLLFSLSVCFTAKAQSTPEAFLSRLPAVPQVICLADTLEITNFTDKIYKIQSEIQEVINSIHAEVQNNIGKTQINNNEKQIRKSVEKNVSEQYGVSIQELEKLGEMSDAEQEKWAQQYANRMKTEAQKNPTAAMKKGDKAKRMFELASEQKMIGERITMKMERIARLFKDVELKDSIETLKLEEKIRPLEQQLCSGICTDAEIARSRIAEKQIYALKVQHCEKMSPLQVNAILQYQTTLKTLLPDYRKLTEVENEVVGLQQIGEIFPKDLSCYVAINEYTTALLSAYKYWIGKFR